MPNSYEYFDEGMVRCQLSIDKLPKHLKDFLLKKYFIYEGGNVRGTARITKLFMLANSVPHFGQIQFWDKSYTSNEENPYINSVAAGSTGTYLVGELDTENGISNKCDFIISSDQIRNNVYNKVLKENENNAIIRKEIVSIFEITLANLLKEEYKTCSSSKYPFWTQNPKREQEFTFFEANNNTTYVGFSTSILDELNTECISSSSLWSCVKGERPKLIWHDNNYYTFMSSSDFNNDLIPEFTINGGNFSPDIFFLRSESNSKSAWRMIPLYHVPYRDCPM
jgi:hypothetical protein